MTTPPDPTLDSEPLALQIESLAHGGDGVAHHEGQVVFVAGALPGESVTVSVTERQPRFLRAGLTEITQPSPDRRALDCHHETRAGCGGCGFRHVEDHAALQMKADAAWQALQRISRRSWPAPQCQPTTTGGARTRLRFHCDGGQIGLHARGSHLIVPVPDCLAADASIPAAAVALQAAWSQAGRTPKSILIEATPAGLFATLAGARPQILEDRAQDALDAGLFAGVRIETNRGPRWLGKEWIDDSWQPSAVGRPTGTPAHRADTLWRRPGAFAQAHATANDQLRDVLWNEIAPTEPHRLLDLYAGSGNLSLPLTRCTAGEVVAVENAPDSLDGLQKSRDSADPQSSFQRARIVEHDLRHGLPMNLGSEAAEVLVLDPPRTGAKNLMPEILELGTPRIIYVSCAPACLARDVAALGDGYTIEGLHAIDMFPDTPHLEMVAVLRRA